MVLAMSNSEPEQPVLPTITPAPLVGTEITEGTTETPQALTEAAKQGRVAIRPKEVGLKLSQSLAESSRLKKSPARLHIA